MNPHSHARTAEATFGYGSSWVKATVRCGLIHRSPIIEILLPNYAPTLSMNTDHARYIIQNLSEAISWVEQEVKKLTF